MNGHLLIGVCIILIGVFSAIIKFIDRLLKYNPEIHYKKYVIPDLSMYEFICLFFTVLIILYFIGNLINYIQL